MDELINCPWKSWYKFLDYADQHGFPDSKALREFYRDNIQHDSLPATPEFMPIYSKVSGGYQFDTFDQKSDYFLMIININTKMGYAYNMPTKSATDVCKALTKFFSTVSGVTSMSSDEDAAYLSASVVNLFKKQNVQLFTTTDEDHHTLGIVNRFIRTIRDLQFRSTQKKTISAKEMTKLIAEYNSSVHRSTGIRPEEMTAKQEESYIHDKDEASAKVKDYNFKIGDHVRIVLTPNKLQKVRTRLSEEAYIIDNKEGRSYWVRALDKSVDKVPAFKLAKCSNKFPLAKTLKNNKRETVEELLEYDEKTDKYKARFEGGDIQNISAQTLREGNPTALTFMEKKFWLKKCPDFPIGVPDKILSVVGLPKTQSENGQSRILSRRRSKDPLA
jgi:hypothetical protein